MCLNDTDSRHQGGTEADPVPFDELDRYVFETFALIAHAG